MGEFVKIAAIGIDGKNMPSIGKYQFAGQLRL